MLFILVLPEYHGLLQRMYTSSSIKALLIFQNGPIVPVALLENGNLDIALLIFGVGPVIPLALLKVGNMDVALLIFRVGPVVPLALFNRIECIRSQVRR